MEYDEEDCSFFCSERTNNVYISYLPILDVPGSSSLAGIDRHFKAKREKNCGVTFELHIERTQSSALPVPSYSIASGRTI